ncbi:cytochrome P450 CYP736A12 [Prunus yedoensis var. nudiflora]|uniref:Cytochrome P450 CYP736A12 n=1 Tax=Prunus yedoensis var. nudiflora TaxID=2094558 RepID=A0A314ZSE1_PRUYE|nr:cytochrome P450 CYP736A12 [Prunus yedoensis var. nudiflora]
MANCLAGHACSFNGHIINNDRVGTLGTHEASTSNEESPKRARRCSGLGEDAIEDCTANGFHIQKASHVIINVWAIGRDPRAWTDAERFIPERFVGINIDVRGNHFELIPFGSGRRRCPGIQLGLTVVQLMVAQLVHCFDWELPNSMLPNELDMSEEFGLTVPRAKHLLAIPSYRLHK